MKTIRVKTTFQLLDENDNILLQQSGLTGEMPVANILITSSEVLAKDVAEGMRKFWYIVQGWV